MLSAVLHFPEVVNQPDLQLRIQALTPEAAGALKVFVHDLLSHHALGLLGGAEV